MNVFAKGDEILSMIHEMILKKQNVTDTKTFRTNGHSDNVKTVYPPTNTVSGGYNDIFSDILEQSAITVVIIHLNALKIVLQLNCAIPIS